MRPKVEMLANQHRRGGISCRALPRRAGEMAGAVAAAAE